MRYRLGTPFGWFFIARADELPPGGVLPLVYFGRNLVLFRTASGEPKLLDAFCPHLGAHLGYGGRVEDDAIVCPFHAWTFNGDGICVKVPYATVTPPIVGRRCLASWPLVERNRCLYAWFHPSRSAPSFAVGSAPGFDDDPEQWLDPIWWNWTVRGHIQDVEENFHDVVHFKSVHGLDMTIDFTYAGHRCRSETQPRDDGEDSYGFCIVTEMNGPGQFWSFHDEAPQFTVLTHATPIDDRTMALQAGILIKKSFAAKLASKWIETFIHNEFEQDVNILDHKIYRASPPLCDADSTIARFREWYQQFYVGELERPAPAAEEAAVL